MSVSLKAQCGKAHVRAVAALMRAVQRATLGAVVALALIASAGTQAAAFETTAPTGILVDFGTGRVLFEKEADKTIAPASLVKLMTVAVIFDELRKGTISRDDRFTVSEYAWRTGGAASGGSTMFLPLNSEVSVDDLIKGIIIQSGNDATIVAAEGIAGSVDAFAAKMNALGKQIGLTGSQFANPHGLPDPDQYVTVRDLAKLAEYLIRTFPEEYPLFSEESFTFNGITQRSRNPLLALGADGLKTGHTSEAGYGLVASAQRDGRRIILAISGMQSADERAREARRLMEYGLQDFEEVVLIEAGEPVGEAVVRGGVAPTVAMTAEEELRLLVPRGSLADVKRVVVDNGPVEAPVAAGQRLGWVRFERGEETLREVPLHAAQPVEQAGLLQRIREALSEHLTWR
ncbi:D-alanyl-D-alanine carboxypeptidase family protein [Aurantimonas sp. HBX-1]|uniref:D-alanyl-D-alanine carboxypeptidase family protein n=1 Tax=Aurantimonas sp. HBX-1 TaxID=2906072 RepID=UPI001F1C0ECB|nr:D-alanyl-D-alanine carboxypeptidase family protein [Aurantimonas sp. HBX-1]UIJ72907.1 D-alanyl-D-alanine carboxypeptidase [Aurantimonas sp. HBX-1]